MLLKFAKKILHKSSPYREPAEKQSEPVKQNTTIDKTDVVSLIIKSEETIPITITMSFNKINQTESGARCEYIINDKSVITIERDGSIESFGSFNLLARLFIDDTKLRK